MKTHAYAPVRTLAFAGMNVESDASLWAPAWELPARGRAKRLQEDDRDEG